MTKNYSFLENQNFTEDFTHALDSDNVHDDLHGVINLWGDNSSALTINIDHIAKNTSSFVNIHAVLRDSAKLKILGDIHISPNASETDTNFTVKVLILGDKARATVLPKLRIECKNIKQAKHAVVIKKISDQDLYFLQSRGVDITDAKNLIVNGFLENV